MYKFSKSTLAFYLPKVHANIPSDAVDVSEIEYSRIQDGLKKGQCLSYSESGRPTAVPPPEKDVATLRSEVKTSLRNMRAPMLDALAGIAGRATRAGNNALAAEADALALQLLDITDDPALNAAATLEDMQAAGVAAYRRIAATANPALASVFKEITGA